MKERTEEGMELKVEERNLLSVAYKNVVGSRRSSWRVISGIAQKADETSQSLAQNYLQQIESELTKICEEVLVSIFIL